MCKRIKWIESDGGPHILIEKDYLSIWKGESDKEFEQAQKYYEEACLIDEFIGELQIGEGRCIIISEDISRSTWIASDDNCGTLVVLNYTNEEIDEEFLIKKISELPDDIFDEIELTYHISHNILYLFPACDFNIGWRYDYCEIKLNTGLYAIKVLEEYTVNNSSFRLFRFSKI